MNKNTNTRKIQMSLNKIADSIDSIRAYFYSLIKNEEPTKLDNKLRIFCFINIIYLIASILIIFLQTYNIYIPNIILTVIGLATFFISIIILSYSNHYKGYISILYEVLAFQLSVYGISYILTSPRFPAIYLALFINVLIWTIMHSIGNYIKEKVKIMYKIVEELTNLRDAIKTFMFEYYSTNYKEKVD